MSELKLRCPKCNTEFRDIDCDYAAELYQKLKPFLAVLPSWGCYVPARDKKRGSRHEDYPLHFWQGPGTSPITIEWSPKRDEKHLEPTFHDFCRAYGLNPIVSEAA